MQTILDFWFIKLNPEQWYRKDDTLDQEIINRFSDIHRQAGLGELWGWRNTIDGRLAEIIILDQFSRNMFRGQATSYQYDSMALTLAQEAIHQGEHLELESVKLVFLLMPYMHSESLLIHNQAVELFSVPGLESALKYEHMHRDIIERFGRYPHRNAILDRESTAEELEFLKQENSKF